MTEDQNADYEISSLERQARDLHQDGLLTSIRDRLEDLDTTLSNLTGRLRELRSRGYVYKNFLEEQAKALGAGWVGIRTRVRKEIDQRSRAMQDDLERVERAVRSLQSYKGRSLNAARSALGRAKSELDSAERQVRAANEAISSMFDQKEADAQALTAQLDGCMRVLDWVDGASFGFRPGEAIVYAIQSKWLKDGEKEGPKGILFLTDQRLVFEQREKVATKKFLFITTASEEVQEMLWEAPVGALEEADATEKRKALIFTRELLTLNFKRPAEVREVLLELEGGDSEEWRALINRVVTGDIEKERVEGAAEAAAEEAAIEVPSKCPNCGASLDVTVVKGMTAIKCVYCGTSIPLTKKS